MKVFLLRTLVILSLVPAVVWSQGLGRDNHAAFEGIWNSATVTPLERPRQLGDKAFFTPAEAAEFERQVARDNEERPPQPGARNTGTYNTFFREYGTRTVKTLRTSIVIDPPEGRVPALTEEARQRQASRLAAFRPTSDQSEGRDPGLEPEGAYDDPERRPLGERCLLGFGSTSGPPILPNYFYNNLHQIVQTPTHVMILTEMVHDARIVRMNAQHLPPTMRFWMGDSIGSWEGDTLVVDTTNFTDKTRYRGSTPDMHVVERFTRVDAKTLKYRFTIDDPKTWTKPWTGEYTWPATDERIYEYACHEGNYALGNILRGARLREKTLTEKK